MRPGKFHGRYDSDGRRCAATGCGEAGEFRAPGGHAHGFDGPGEWRWLCFDDPLDAIGARASEIKRAAGSRQQAARFTPKERAALEVMGLGPQAGRPELRRRYSELVRRYHPDRNGGDRGYERRLQMVVEAYQLLRKAAAFA